MINKSLTGHFQSAKIEQNVLCRFSESAFDDDYQDQLNNNKQSPLLANAFQQNTGAAGEQDVNLEELWDSLESGEAGDSTEKGKIRVAIMHVEQRGSEQETACEIIDEDFEKMLADLPKQEAKTGEEEEENEGVEDLGDIWDQLGQQEPETTEDTSLKQSERKNVQEVSLPPLPAETPTTETIHKAERFDLSALLSQKGEKSLNYNLNREYLIYDYQAFVMGCFQTNVHSYFGFSESQHNRNLFHLYDLTTREPILECTVDTYDQSFQHSNAKKVKIDYEIEYCLKFRLAKTGQLVATAFHKYINNGILYNIKPYNHYENQYEDSLALVEITDGFIGSNCYCNTNVYISQKYTNQPGQLKMIIGLKNGFLIANMGVNGVKSAPYNCRLENYQSNFVYLLGMVNKESCEFIVRVGEGMSPLIAFAISIGRKRYIDSFTE